ncbi:MAG: hypothetical protein HC822_27150 [Oscillochloris sp.]|nr:hypothetical protein [Oscillochloris sp.]
MLIDVAQEIGRTPSQVAINWVRGQRRTCPVIPIVGAWRGAQMRDNLGCLEFSLSDEQLERLTAASPFNPGFPHSFLRYPHLKQLIYSGALERMSSRSGAVSPLVRSKWRM